MRIIKYSERNLSNILKEAAQVVKKGGVLICPTDTIYGLVCDVTNKKAIEKLFKIKKRPPNKPIPVFVCDIKMAKEIVNMNKKQVEFLEKVWPGAVTVVLKRKSREGTIGLRVPDHKFVLGLAEHIGPLTGTSANISGQPGSTKIKDILRQFKKQKNKPDLVIDAGNLPRSKPSTVIDLTIWPPEILRV